MTQDIKTLHIELSSIPADRYPQSHSNVQGYPYNQGFVETNLSLADCKKIFSPTFLSSLKKIIIAGNFGDFVSNPESLEIIEYFYQHCYGDIQINTNGSQRIREFWQTLGKLGVTVFFLLDGMEDTLPLTRPGADFATSIENAQSFIDAGGHAIWKMTVTDINRHQINSANTKSIELGFADFIFYDAGPGEGVVYDTTGKKIHPLTSDSFWKDQIDDQFVKDEISHADRCPIPERQTGLKIKPYCVKTQSIYVSATGHVYPCDRTGVDPINFKPYMRNPWRYYNPEISKYIKNNHAPTVGLEEAAKWIQGFSQTWDSDHQPRVCQKFCGEVND